MKTFYPKVMRFIDSGFHELSRFEVKRFYPWIFKAFLVLFYGLFSSRSGNASHQFHTQNRTSIPCQIMARYQWKQLCITLEKYYSLIKQKADLLKNSFSSRWLFKVKANGTRLRRYSSFGRRANRFKSYRRGIIIYRHRLFVGVLKMKFLVFLLFRSKPFKRTQSISNLAVLKLHIESI